MSHHEHPSWPVRHRPDIKTNDLGSKVTCTCGWWSTKPNEPQAARAYLDHTIAAKEETP